MTGSHRKNAHFSRAGWKKRIMLPCWIIQVLILLSLMGLFSYRLSHTITVWEDNGKTDVPIIEFVWAVANIGFSLVSLVVTFVSIARFIAEVLTPIPLLFGCILNVVLAGAVLALDIVVYVLHSDKKYSLIGLALDATLILFTIIPLIYAVIIYRRLLTYDDYHLPGNHKPFGFAGIEEGVDDRYSGSYNSRHTSYDPVALNMSSNEGKTTTTVTSGELKGRDRSISIGSHRVSLSLSRGASVSPYPSPPLESEQQQQQSQHERRVSYDHKRDTQFEAYAARRASHRRSPSGRSNYRQDSSASLQDVKRALGDEFGFGLGDLPSPREPGRVSTKGSDEMVNSGSIYAVHPVSRPRVSSVGRQPSYETVIIGGTTANSNGMGFSTGPVLLTVTTPPEDGLHRGFSLSRVPEAHEEEDRYTSPTAVHTRPLYARRRAVSESQQALLGKSPEAFEGLLEDVELDSGKHGR